MFTNLRSYPHIVGRGAELVAPHGWSVAPLRRLVDVHGGMTPSMSRREFWDGGVPWVTPKDMKRPLISDSIDHISTTAIRKTSLSLIPAGAVLIVVRGMILARHVPIARTLRPTTINQDMKALVARPGVLPDFLHYMLIGENLRLLALVSESGHGTRKLETALWREVELALPPADEQAAIVRYLAHAHARIDRGIAAKRKLIALLDEQKQAIINQAVTRGLDPTVPLKDTGIPWLGRIPEHWEVRKLSSIFARQGSGTTPPDPSDYGGGIPWVMSGDLNEGIVAETRRSVTLTALERLPALKLYPAGSLIVAMYGATIGKTGLTGMPAATNQACCVFSAPRPGMDVRYLQHALRTSKPGLLVEAFGGGQPNVNADVVKQLRVPVPPAREQAAIAEHLVAATQTLGDVSSRCRREIDLLREFRTRLTSDVVTGQVDVRHIAATLPDLDPDELTAKVGGTDDDLVDEAAEFLEDVDA